MWSTTKIFAAAAIVALFGGFLLAGVLTEPSTEEVPPATVTEAPSPTSNEEPAFPTGTFVSEPDGLTLEFRADGTCDRAGVPCTFGVVGDFFVETTFEEPSGTQVPATYYWDFDGERLTFEPWGTDKRPGRQETYLDHDYRPVGETVPLPAAITDFPTGMFVPADGSGTPWIVFAADGTLRTSMLTGQYVVDADLWTEVWNNSDIVEQVPATYFWEWDGVRLTFNPWGEDGNRFRSDDLSHAFVRDEASAALAGVRVLLLGHPQLDVWTRVEVAQRDDGRYEATAPADEEPLGEGVGDTLQEAVRAALQALGEPYASDMAASVAS